jgi:hypothetical protein
MTQEARLTVLGENRPSEIFVMFETLEIKPTNFRMYQYRGFMKIILTFIIIFSSTIGFANDFESDCLGREGKYVDKEVPFENDALRAHLVRTCTFDQYSAINTRTINLLINSCERKPGEMLIVQARNNQLNVECWTQTSK